MEVFVIILIAGAAIAAVLIPLLRRGPASDPMLDAPAGSTQDLAETGASSPADLEKEIRRYREALRANTVCRRCGAANPAGSRFCAECGRRLGDSRRAA